MDTSETYIKMSDCPEIQSVRGEVWITFGEGILYSYEDVYYKCLTKDGNGWHLIWLPRQDQLQEMVRASYSNLDEFVYLFWGWITTKCPEKILGLTSMEQLWLAFVMKEKFNKVWNGEEWAIQ